MFMKQKSASERIIESVGNALSGHGGTVAVGLGAATLALAGTIVGASAVINAVRAAR